MRFGEVNKGSDASVCKDRFLVGRCFFCCDLVFTKKELPFMRILNYG